MGKFVFGLIVGVVVGVLAMTVNPNLPQELRAGLANLTEQVMRGIGQMAGELGDAAEEFSDEAEPPADAEPPVVSGPAAPADPRAPEPE